MEVPVIVLNTLTTAGGKGDAPIENKRTGRRQSGGEADDFVNVCSAQLGMFVHTI